MRVDIPKDGMIKDVECLCPELQRKSIVQVELSPNCDIELRSSETANKVSRGIACNPRGWKAKRSFIDGLTARILIAIDKDWFADYKIQPPIRNTSRCGINNLIAYERDWKCAAHIQASVKTPAI